MRNQLIKLNHTNKKLIRRIQKGRYFYILSIIFICLFLCTLIITSLFPKNKSNLLLTFKYISFFVVFFDTIAIILRIQNRSFITPHHLAIFPLSKWDKFKYHMVLYLLDYKSLIYLSVSICYAIFFLSNRLYLSAVLNFIIWFLLLSIILAWVILLFNLLWRYLVKLKTKTQMIGLLYIIIIMGIESFGDNALTKVPITSNIGNIFYGLLFKNTGLILTNLIIAIFGLILPLFLFSIFKISTN